MEAHTLPIRAECSVKEQSWNILYDIPASVVLEFLCFWEILDFGNVLATWGSGQTCATSFTSSFFLSFSSFPLLQFHCSFLSLIYLLGVLESRGSGHAAFGSACG